MGFNILLVFKLSYLNFRLLSESDNAHDYRNNMYVILILILGLCGDCTLKLDIKI